MQADVDAADFAEGFFVGLDRGDLRTRMHVQKFEAVEHGCLFQALGGCEKLCRGEAELRACAGRARPFSGAPRGEFGPQPKVRSDAEFARGLDDALQFAVTVDDDDRPAAQALGQQGGLDVGAILVSVADQQGIRRVE